MRNLIFLALAILAPAIAADQTNLKIVVTNPTGKPIENASVIVKFVQGRSKAKFGAKIRTEWDLKTNLEGTVKIPSVPQGKILIQVIAKNFQIFGENFDIEEEERTIEIKLNAPQPQYTAHPK